MKDRLESFVEEHRDEFDVYEPNPQVWRSIEKTMRNEPKVLKLSFNWRIAAAIALIIGFGFTVFRVANRTPQPEDSLAKINPEYAQTAYHMAALIDIKRDELKQIQKEQPELYQEFSGDLERLDKNYQAMKIQLGGAANQETVVEAMIQNLQLQIDLLNQQLTIIQRINNKNKQYENKGIAL
ncbi:hypothetical protein C3K47_07515 [Solitalea longa]|uniref:Anti-sigma factor n=1 Tax=Solitalea longa TaxID=2079460 RepID=A0A2S5A2Y2_9SPHI|nr:hypothetical protein [Solitalea longa]POY36905.1 hypothetical protein C3K47_07515 [Solitalea longa]